MKYEEDYFGNCPVCHQTDGCCTIPNENWFVCDDHCFRGCVGTGLFSGRPYADNWEARATQVIASYTVLTLDEVWHPAAHVADTLLQTIVDAGER
jgi:hypothetical protein